MAKGRNRDRKGNLVVKVPMSNDTCTVTLRTTYPDFGLRAREESEISDLLHEDAATEPLVLIHGDILGPMPVESVSKYKYGFILTDDYSRASWVLLLRARSDAPIEFGEVGQPDGERNR